MAENNLSLQSPPPNLTRAHQPWPSLLSESPAMSPRGSADGDDDSQLFAGVHFALVGFDPISDSQYRSEIVRRGGANAGGRGTDCTNVVVCDLVYDDPVCVVPQEDWKQVVTELWVDDSLDLGVVADADRVTKRMGVKT